MSQSQPFNFHRGALLVATAITPIHAGAGRGYGVVDLPIQRDALGYPEIWASSIKGALKAYLLRKYRGNQELEKAVQGFFGSEPEETPTVPGIAMLHNLVPLAIPAPSVTHGLLYVTTPYLLSRVKNYIEIVKVCAPSRVTDPALFDKLREVVSRALELSNTLNESGVLASSAVGSEGDSVALGTMELSIVKTIDCGYAPSINALNALYQVHSLSGKLVVVSDRIGRSVIEASIQRVYRVRLDRVTKTVERGALWSEEYLPHGTLLVGLLVWQDPKTVSERVKQKVRNSRSERERIEHEKYKQYYEPLANERNLNELLGALHYKFIVVGGKETIGRGILKLALASPSSEVVKE